MKIVIELEEGKLKLKKGVAIKKELEILLKYYKLHPKDIIISRSCVKI